MSDTQLPIEAQRFAPPQARVAEAPDTEQRPGSRGGRLGAALIDGLLQFGAIFLLARVSPWNPFVLASSGVGGMFAMQGVGLVLFIVLHGYLLVRHGQTIGKRLLGLRVVRPDGQAVGIGRLIGLRYGAGFLISAIPAVGMFYPLLDALLIFGRQRRCIHDWIADTIVIRA